MSRPASNSPSLTLKTSSGGDQIEDKLKQIVYPFNDFKSKKGDFAQGVCCILQATSSVLEDASGRRLFDCVYIAQTNASFQYDRNDEVISNFVQLKYTGSEDIFGETDVTIIIPHCISRASALYKEPVIKAKLNNAWIYLDSEEIAQDDFKDGRFVQASFKDGVPSCACVVSRFKKDMLKFQRQATRLCSSVDQRLTVKSEHGCFPDKVAVTMQVQHVDTNTMTRLQRKTPDGRCLMSSSSIVSIDWNDHKFRKYITVNLPIPANPVKIKKLAKAEAAKNDTAAERDKKRRAEAKKEDKATKWYMGIYGDDENDLLFLFHYDILAESWTHLPDVHLTEIRKDLVSFQMTKPLHKFVVLRCRTEVQPADARTLVYLLEEQLSLRAVKFILVQNPREHCRVTLHCVSIQKYDTLYDELYDYGYRFYGTHGPPTSKEVMLKEGCIFDIGFRGNIKFDEKFHPLGKKVMKNYNSQMTCQLSFTITEADKHLQRTYDFYKGVCMIQSTEKALLPEVHLSNLGSTKSSVSALPSHTKKVSPSLNPDQEKNRRVIAELMLQLAKGLDNGPQTPHPPQLPIKLEPICVEAIEAVSTKLGKEWEVLAKNLGLTRGRVEALKTRNKHTPENVKGDMLYTWIKRQPRASDRLPKLYYALMNCGRIDLAYKIEDIYATEYATTPVVEITAADEVIDEEEEFEDEQKEVTLAENEAISLEEKIAPTEEAKTPIEKVVSNTEKKDVSSTTANDNVNNAVTVISSVISSEKGEQVTIKDVRHLPHELAKIASDSDFTNNVHSNALQTESYLPPVKVIANRSEEGVEEEADEMEDSEIKDMAAEIVSSVTDKAISEIADDVLMPEHRDWEYLKMNTSDDEVTESVDSFAAGPSSRPLKSEIERREMTDLAKVAMNKGADILDVNTPESQIVDELGSANSSAEKSADVLASLKDGEEATETDGQERSQTNVNNSSADLKKRQDGVQGELVIAKEYNDTVNEITSDSKTNQKDLKLDADFQDNVNFNPNKEIKSEMRGNINPEGQADTLVKNQLESFSTGKADENNNKTNLLVLNNSQPKGNSEVATMKSGNFSPGKTIKSYSEVKSRTNSGLGSRTISQPKTLTKSSTGSLKISKVNVGEKKASFLTKNSLSGTGSELKAKSIENLRKKYASVRSKVDTGLGNRTNPPQKFSSEPKRESIMESSNKATKNNSSRRVAAVKSDSSRKSLISREYPNPNPMEIKSDTNSETTIRRKSTGSWSNASTNLTKLEEAVSGISKTNFRYGRHSDVNSGLVENKSSVVGDEVEEVILPEPTSQKSEQYSNYSETFESDDADITNASEDDKVSASSTTSREKEQSDLNDTYDRPAV